MEKLYLPNNKELTMESQEKHKIEWKSVWKDEYFVHPYVYERRKFELSGNRRKLIQIKLCKLIHFC